ncbi:type IV pilus secretin PilQ [Rosenbergiella nectarea]|uniref:type IV pilus secretin PilQ n=1 Tax=Rosenbergiella nectarea TaxID=988801 RepID=UPI001BDAF054|nr:type IV pilus secretin PilQ [Rosenbergiella nectarea]MBT0730876.1 type IV pilus secretin PilQ [Rosenbergiella nectarea subsp. apis]
MRSARSFLFMLTIFLTGSALASSKISINAENTPVAQIFSLLASAKDFNIVVDPSIEQSLTLHLIDVEWQDALDIIKDLTKVEVIQHANILVVRESASQGSDNDRGGSAFSPPQAELEQKVFPLKFIGAAELEKQLTARPFSRAGGKGKRFIDHDRQQLTVWDDAESIQEIEQWIALHDHPQPQIEITAQMISISQDNLRELGVSWFSDTSSLGPERVAKHEFTTSLGVAAPTFQAKTAITRIDSRLLFLELSALEQENQLEIIASPHLVTSQGRTASIKQGTEIPYQTVSGKNENPVIHFKEAMLGMEVTPERVGQEYIRLRLRLNQDVPGKVLQGDGKGPPSIEKQEITTEVLVANGTTIALGGVFQQQHQQGMAAVPWLGKIPLLGVLFQKQTQQRQKRELVIFITPRLLPIVNIP